MPCTDGGVPYPPTREEKLDAKVPIPALCAFLRVLSPILYLQALDLIDWTEAGIRREEFVEWWKMHQERDRLRQRQARSDKVQENIRKQALAKLSPAERDALGLKK